MPEDRRPGAYLQAPLMCPCGHALQRVDNFLEVGSGVYQCGNPQCWNHRIPYRYDLPMISPKEPRSS